MYVFKLIYACMQGLTVTVYDININSNCKQLLLVYLINRLIERGRLSVAWAYVGMGCIVRY